MKLLIVHLSDIHLKSSGNAIMERKDRILSAVQNQALEVDVSYIILSGDIAYSGQQDEYEQAVKLLDHLKQGLESYSNKPVHIQMIPGNHDCDYSIKSVKARDMLIKQIQHSKDGDIDESIKDACCEVHNNYFTFAELYTDTANTYYHDKLLSVSKYNVGNTTIVFNCFNTSWLSQLHEQYGRLHFPILLYKEILTRDSDLTISILHHPFNWQDHYHVREFSMYLEDISDIIITGHEHDTDKKLIDDLAGNVIEYIDGHVLQDNDDDMNSGFNSLVIDLDARMQNIRSFKWNGQLFNDNNLSRTTTIKIPGRRQLFFPSNDN
jgi:predicted MPP superfamily phosphohydrolase